MKIYNNLSIEFKICFDLLKRDANLSIDQIANSFDEEFIFTLSLSMKLLKYSVLNNTV
jgi:hypothetical protein